MANTVFHTEYNVTVHLTHADLGHRHLPDLLSDITTPVKDRKRELLQCPTHHERGTCAGVEAGASPWMAVRRRTTAGRTTLYAAHLPIRHQRTSKEGDVHKAFKERVVRTAHRNNLKAGAEVVSADRKIVTDVLVEGDASAIGWEIQKSYLTESSVRRRTRAAQANNIQPLWVTDDDRAPLIDRAPWARTDTYDWRDIRTRPGLLVRAGVRHLQEWKCTPSAERTCPLNGYHCGDHHFMWELPALCLPARPFTQVDDLIVASAHGEYVPHRTHTPGSTRAAGYIWTPAADRDRYHQLTGEDDPDDEDLPSPDSVLVFTEEDPDLTCRYGDETPAPYQDRRPARERTSPTGLRTLAARVPRQRTLLTSTEREAAARRHGCKVWEIGLCAGCAAPIRRHGPGAQHACKRCRNRATEAP